MVWYKEGIKFKCSGCASCCTGCPGYVWIDKKDIEIVSKFLKISKDDFIKRYVRFVNSKMSLKENLINYDCCFLKDKKCLIYEVRPKQCKTFPFWKSSLQSKDNFENLKKTCPGIDSKDSILYSLEDIEKNL